MPLIYNPDSQNYEWDYSGGDAPPADQAPLDPKTGQALPAPPNSTWDATKGGWNTPASPSAAAPSPDPTPAPKETPAPDPKPSPTPAPAPAPTSTASGPSSYDIAAQATSQASDPGLTDLLKSLITQQQGLTDRQTQQINSQMDWATQTRSNIMDRFKTASAPVTAQDPIIAQQAHVFDFGKQRENQDLRETMAARNTGWGGDMTSGAADAAVQSGTENMNIARSGYLANAMSQEYDKRRAEIENLLQLGAGVMTADENRQLQQELGSINSMMSSLKLQSDSYLGGAGLDNSLFLGNKGLNIQGQSVGNQNQQFYDTMGYNIGRDNATFDYLYKQLAGGA